MGTCKTFRRCRVGSHDNCRFTQLSYLAGRAIPVGLTDAWLNCENTCAYFCLF